MQVRSGSPKVHGQVKFGASANRGLGGVVRQWATGPLLARVAEEPDDNGRADPPDRRHRFTSTLFILTLAYSALIQAFLAQPGLYDLLRAVLYGLVSVLVLSAAATGQFKIRNRAVAFIGWVIVLSQGLRAILSIAFSSDLVGFDILLLPFIMVILGSNLVTDLKRSRLIVCTYAVASAIPAWYVVWAFSPESTTSQQYFFAQKNQIGAVLGAVSALLLYEVVRTLNRKPALIRRALFPGALLVLNLVPLFAIRNRSSIVGLVILALILAVKGLLGKGSTVFARVALLGVVVFAIVFSRELGEIFDRTLFGNFDVSDLNNVSANRVDVYQEGIDFLRENLLFGQLAHPSSISSPHNFVLFQLVEYGLILSLGYLVVYLLFSMALLKTWISTPLPRIGPWAYLLVVSFTTSLFEYAQPFGPGTTQMAAWYFLGVGLSRGGSQVPFPNTITGVAGSPERLSGRV